MAKHIITWVAFGALLLWCGALFWIVAAAGAFAGIYDGVASRGPCVRQAPPFKVVEPSVPYVIRYKQNVSAQCRSGFAQACSGQYAEGKWVIWVGTTYMGEKASPLELRCIINHEKAHLPPNNWSTNHMGRSGPQKWYPDGLHVHAP